MFWLKSLADLNILAILTTALVFQLSNGSLKFLASLKVSDMSVILLVNHASNGLLKMVQSSNIPAMSVTLLRFQSFNIPLKTIAPLNMFLKLVTCDKSGAAIASKFRFWHPKNAFSMLFHSMFPQEVICVIFLLSPVSLK